MTDTLIQYLPPLVGGILIGLASVGLMFFNGRIAGISGILGGLLSPAPGEASWRGFFVGGLALGGVLLALLYPVAFPTGSERSLGALVAAGLMVGFGTRLGSGCTSGHGVCGMSRFSRRSIVATLTFIFTGAVAVFVVNNFFGGTV